mmetsp:Transcript_10738/g.35241  ORF Transcript_10738/g.35241 Transcript_10738/m.35241 type:complete len:146 (+) Transcript_10738:470-907(+)
MGVAEGRRAPTVVAFLAANRGNAFRLLTGYAQAAHSDPLLCRLPHATLAETEAAKTAGWSTAQEPVCRVTNPTVVHMPALAVRAGAAPGARAGIPRASRGAASDVRGGSIGAQWSSRSTLDGRGSGTSIESSSVSPQDARTAKTW